jgi:hypothetical protein
MILAVPIMLPMFAALRSKAEPQKAVEVWSCFGEGHRSQSQLEISPVAPNRWSVTRTLTATDDSSKSSLIGARSRGTIDLITDTESFVALKAELSGKPSFDGDYDSQYEGTTLFRKQARDEIFWQYYSKHTEGPTISTLRWTESCAKGNPNNKPTFWSALPGPLPQQITPAKVPTHPAPSQENLTNLTKAWEEQIKKGLETTSSRGTTIIATVFGYFKYKSEIDLTKGPRQFRLEFVPYVFPEENSYGNEINDQLAKVQFSLLPDLQIAAPSIQVKPPDQSSQLLRQGWPLEWHWTVTQSTFSGVSETNGGITVKISSGGGSPLVATLPVEVTAKPWWWLLPWIWENLLGKPEVSCTFLVFLVISMRKGFRAGIGWIWDRITNIGEGETRTRKQETKPKKNQNRT